MTALDGMKALIRQAHHLLVEFHSIFPLEDVRSVYTGRRLVISVDIISQHEFPMTRAAQSVVRH